MRKLRKVVSMIVAGALLLGAFSPGAYAVSRAYADAAEVSAEKDLKYLAFTDKVENGADITARELDVENMIRLSDEVISDVTLEFYGNYIGAGPAEISAKSKASDVFKVNYEPGRYQLTVTDTENRRYHLDFNVFFSIRDDNYWEERTAHTNMYPVFNRDDVYHGDSLIYCLQRTSLDASYQGDDYRLEAVRFGMSVYGNGKYVSNKLYACNLRCKEDADWKRHIGMVPGQSDLIEAGAYNEEYHYYLTAMVPVKVPVGIDIMDKQYHDDYDRGILYYEVEAKNMELTDPDAEPDSGASSGSAVTAPAAGTVTPTPSVPVVKDTPKTGEPGTKIGSAIKIVKKERLPKVILKKYKKGTKVIKGTAKARSRVVLKVGKKKYTVKASKKGKFTVKLKKKLKKGQKITVYAKLAGWKNSKKVSKKVK